jgi:iron complex transport system substrate-binding protein
MSARWYLLIAFLCAAQMVLADGAPKRIVSINACLDPVLVELVPRERIAALSRYSSDPWRSSISDVARQLPATRESAEEIVMLKPDVVLASRHTALQTRHALERVGVHLELFDVPRSIESSLAQVKRLAELLQEPARGQELIARIEQAVERSKPPAGTRQLTAAIFQPGGMSAGAGTITDDLMNTVGLTNAATRAQLSGYRVIPLESLLSMAPDIVLIGDTLPGDTTRAEKLVHHRALRSLESQISVATFPAKYMNCAGPVLIPALDALVAAREQAMHRTARTVHKR